jgi:UDP-N-acetylmuramoylalanine--D-glutamate ligase
MGAAAGAGRHWTGAAAGVTGAMQPTESRETQFRDKRVVILGLARQGTALARYLVRAGARVTLSDQQPAAALGPALATLAGLPVELVLGGHPESLLDGCDLLCLSGGVPPDLPLVAAARARGIALSNDAQITLERCPARVTIGITGSAGKTTTATLVGEMCRAGGYRTWVGGNIGNPLIEQVDEIAPGDRVVLELSSFQLELMTRAPAIAAVLNITPNHLDRHPDMASYSAAKARIVRFQSPDGVAVLGYDNPAARALAAQAPGRVVFFSGESAPPAPPAPAGNSRPNGAGPQAPAAGEPQAGPRYGAYLRGARLIVRQAGEEQPVCDRSELQLPGWHNVLNLLAACAICAEAEVPVPAMRSIALGFRGVAHRLELVRERDGVRWYDDSIATAPERTVAALRSFDTPIVLLAGGRDKKLPWEEFAAVAAERVRDLVVFGEAAELIAGAIERQQAAERANGARARGPRVHRARDLAEAVALADRLARPGDVVLLSPGGTSFDAFRDFAERGERFKALVRALGS